MKQHESNVLLTGSGIPAVIPAGPSWPKDDTATMFSQCIIDGNFKFVVAFAITEIHVAGEQCHGEAVYPE